nr:transposase, MuDR, MULE transposase domain protein [Tanacetum cinerariifolium]
MINLTYKLCSDTIDLCDDDDIEVFIDDILSSNDLVPKIFITLSHVIASSKSKSTDFDLNIPLHDPNNLTYSSFKYMPSPPRAPPVVIKETKTHAHNIALPINVGDKFDNKAIDGAHLKGTYLGTNLLAVGMDANNQIMPLATG